MPIMYSAAPVAWPVDYCLGILVILVLLMLTTFCWTQLWEEMMENSNEKCWSIQQHWKCWWPEVREIGNGF